MRKIINNIQQSVDITADNLKEEINLNKAVELEILEKVSYGVWRLRL